MPELPDLVHIEKVLKSEIIGEKILSVDVKDPIVLRINMDRSLEEILAHKEIHQVHRHGPFIHLALDTADLVFHCMLTGAFRLRENKEKKGRHLCISFDLESGCALEYLDETRMGKVYLIPPGKTEGIPRYDSQGINILSDAFTEDQFLKLVSKKKNQIRVFLMDQTILSAIGNAYADEILFDAKIHPKTYCQSLTDEERKKLYASILSVIRKGISKVENANKALEVKVRDHMLVRNKKDSPCPRCNTKIRRASVLGVDTFFCPNCQVPKSKQFIDWKTLPSS